MKKLEKIMASNNEIGETINVSKITKMCRNLNPQELLALLRHNISIFWSWGANSFVLDSKSNCKMFRMTVQGHHHKGHVYIFVNGMDLFDVYLTSSQGKIKDKIEGLYFDDLVESIDKKVERIPEYKS